MSASLRSSLRALWPLVLICIGVQVGLGLVAARTYLARHNTLQANGQWRATKSELSRGLLGAFAFVTERQTLAGGRLHLDAWHGFHEVIHREPVVGPARLEFSFELAKGAWLVALFDRAADGSAAGVRLSSTPWRPSAFLEIGADGEFSRREPFAPADLGPGRHHAVVDFGPERVELRIDGTKAASFDYRPRGEPFFGFRGGSRPASVDDVSLTLADGRRIRESFDAPAGATRVTATFVAATVLLNLALFAGLRRRSRAGDKVLGFQFFTINLTLLVVAALFFVFVALRSAWYPRLDETLQAAEVYFGKGASTKVRAEIQERYAAVPAAGRMRVLFVGSSQTWGAGAAHDDQVFVPVLERLLRQRHPGSVPIECINAGISGTKAAQLAPLLAEEWLALAPRIVVVNLSSNDRGSGARFRGAVRAMIEAARAAGATPVLVQEANSIEEMEGRLAARHRELAAIGDELGVQVVAMHAHLAEFEEGGFLFWDKVHLTPWGQRLVAAKLADELEPLVAARLAEIAALPPG